MARTVRQTVDSTANTIRTTGNIESKITKPITLVYMREWNAIVAIVKTGGNPYPTVASSLHGKLAKHKRLPRRGSGRTRIGWTRIEYCHSTRLHRWSLDHGQSLSQPIVYYILCERILHIRSEANVSLLAHILWTNPPT